LITKKKRKRNEEQSSINQNSLVENVEYDILGFARKKFLFKTRPKIQVPTVLLNSSLKITQSTLPTKDQNKTT